MDPVSHMAFGRTLVALDSRRALGPGAIAACVLGSLAPDVDAVSMPIGWDIYLRRHQGGTHSLIGSIACAALTAAVIWASLNRDRSRPRRRNRQDARVAAMAPSPRAEEPPRPLPASVSEPAPRYLWLLLAAWAGTAGHLLLDVISGADVRVFWPVGSPVALPLFAMADPWLGGVLVLGLVMLALTRTSSARMAVSILMAVTVLAGVKAALYTKAQGRDDTSGGSVQFKRAETEWGSLTRWIMYETRADVVDARRVNALTGTVTPLLHVPRGLAYPLVDRSRDLNTVQNFLAAHDVTFAIVIGAGADRRQVLWSDLRYCGPPDHRAAPWAPIDLGSRSPVSCALWFGGEFDPATGVPGASIVHVGHLVQRRPIH